MSTPTLSKSDLEAVTAAEREAAEAYAAYVRAEDDLKDMEKNGGARAMDREAVRTARERFEVAAGKAELLKGRTTGRTGIETLPAAGTGTNAAEEMVRFFAGLPEADTKTAPQDGAKIVPSLIEMALSRPVGGFKAAIDGGSFGAHTFNASTWADLPRRPLSILDLIPIAESVGGLGGEKVQYFKTTVRTNAAATTAALAELPASTLTVKREETELWTYSHISDQLPVQLIYAPGNLQGYMENDMAQSCLEAHEADILSGTGTTEVDGITNVSGTLTQPSTGDPIADIRKALTQLQNANITPDALVLNPSDAETLDLEITGQGEYLMGGPLLEGEPRLWRTRLIVSTGLSAGTAILGNFRIGATRWTGVSRIEWGRINTDFSHGAVRLAAMVGASAAIQRPGAFCKVSL